ncbi:hypothetical protein BH11MYX3_BH11MYX3_48330 [soil metagenome]
MKIIDLPFIERPVHELLHLEVDRDVPSHDYAGFGWARVDRLWLAVGEEPGRLVRDALVLALHSADDGEVLADDVELEFELPDRADRPVSVLASTFLSRWLPMLPDASAIVLALCNPHRADLQRPAEARSPIHYGLGDVESWREDPDRILLTAESWCTLSA